MPANTKIIKGASSLDIKYTKSLPEWNLPIFSNRNESIVGRWPQRKDVRSL